MPPNQSNNDELWRKLGVDPPKTTSHDITPEDISQKMQSVNPRNWRAEGNTLIADTDFGPLHQKIPTSHIFTGTDDKGLPTFKKIDIS